MFSNTRVYDLQAELVSNVDTMIIIFLLIEFLIPGQKSIELLLKNYYLPNWIVITNSLSFADDGTLYSFGGDYYGCLAQDTEEQVLSPTPITQFDYTISQVSTGDCHVVVLTQCGKVFSWGCGEFGKYDMAVSCCFIDLQFYFIPARVQGQLFLHLSLLFKYRLKHIFTIVNHCLWCHMQY